MFKTSVCPKCEGTHFELAIKEPSDSKYQLNFIQCSKCKAPIGVVEYYNAGIGIQKLEKQINSLNSRLDNIEHLLRGIATKLQA